jgi:hypothetical protein
MMYTGTIIDELFAVVERAENRTLAHGEVDELESWYTMSQQRAAAAEPALLGVA